MWEHTLPSISVCCQIKIKYRLQQLIQNAKKKECLKALIILKCVPGTDWDAVSTVLLNLHRSLIRSKLDYIYTDVSFTVHPVHRISSCLIQSIIKDYDSPFQRSERLQLGVSRLNQLDLETDVSNLVCSMHPNWRLILQILHTTVFLIHNMKMFTINNPIQFNLLDSE
jgi:hypothetical protein